MADNPVQIRVTADMARIIAQFQALGGAGAGAAQRIQAAIPPLSYSMREIVEQTDKGILSNRESTRLLTEELGIHMPRAITSAISEIMPSIGDMGTALVGVFAVKELYEFEKGLTALYADFDGLTEATEEMEEVGKENIRLVDELARKSKAYALGEVTDTLHRIQAENAEIKILEDRRDLMEAYFGPMAALIDKPLGKTKELDEVTKQLHIDEKAGFELSTILAGDLEKEEKAREKAAAAEKQAAAEEKAHRFLAYGPPLIKQNIDGMTKSIEVWGAYQEIWNSALTRSVQVLPLVKQHIAGLVTPIQQVNYVLHTQISTLKAVSQGMQADTAAQAEQLAAGLAGLVGGRKAQAAVKTVWETARGIACLAEGAWPPNPAAIIAAGLHFEAAAQCALMGGGGGGGRRGSAGAGGGASGTAGGGQAVDRGGSGRGGGGYTVHNWYVNGLVSTDTMQQFFTQAGVGQSTGLIKLNANTVSSLPASRA